MNIRIYHQYKAFRPLAIPLLVIIVLGYIIYRQFFVSSGPALRRNVISQDQPQEVYAPPEPPENFGSQERELFLLLVKQNPAANEQNQIFQLAEALAKEAAEIRFQDCVPSPFVLKKKDGEHVDIKNAGPDKITLTMAVVDKQQTLTIIPGDSESFVADKGSGLFGYGCSSASGNSTGLIMVK